MAGNAFGQQLVLTTFGESHGKAIGGILDGMPSGVPVALSVIQSALDRRRPGHGVVASARKESDSVEILSGLHPDIDSAGCQLTLGTPIGFVIHNQDQASKDYGNLSDVYRPGHADYGYEMKYGLRDHRGGGRSSARETACRVVGGAIASQLLGSSVTINAYVSRMAGVALPDETKVSLLDARLHPSGCPDVAVGDAMLDAVAALLEKGDSAGGVITVVVKGAPAGWGEPVFNKLGALIMHAMGSINAVKGVEIGSGFAAADRKGSENNDAWTGLGESKSNHAGGIIGGISTGQDIVARVAFKPVSSIAKAQTSVNLDGDAVKLSIVGRHDAAVLPRACAIVEAMMALVLADCLLLQRIQDPSS